ncbi:MAG: inositol monophosphatase family protein [Pseudomonadota bacterium]
MSSPTNYSRDLDADITIANELADAAEVIALKHFRALDSVINKADSGKFDPVTIADRDCETAMRAILNEVCPKDGIIGEEHGVKASESGWNWLLDPIDGTRAFVAGITSWTCLISLVDPDGTPQIGIIDVSSIGERYIGAPDGAWLRKSDGSQTAIAVSKQTDLRQATIATTDPFIMTPAEQGAWTHLRHTAAITRYGLDAYGYARLAAGTIDLVAETGLAPWDTAALIPVVRGAGGLACDWTGAPAKPGGQIVCVSSQELLDQALISLRRSAIKS